MGDALVVNSIFLSEYNINHDVAFLRLIEEMLSVPRSVIIANLLFN